MSTVHNEAEGKFYDYTTRGLIEYTVELLRDAGLILRDGETDYAAAGLLEVLGDMHDDTGINVERLPQVRAFCICVLDGAGWSE